MGVILLCHTRALLPSHAENRRCKWVLGLLLWHAAQQIIFFLSGRLFIWERLSCSLWTLTWGQSPDTVFLFLGKT